MRRLLFAIFLFLPAVAEAALCEKTDPAVVEGVLRDTRSAAPCTAAPVPNMSATVGEAFERYFPAYIWGCGEGSVDPVWSGTLPAGVSLNAATGEAEGTPTTAGTYSASVTCTSALGSETNNFTLTVVGDAPATFVVDASAGTGGTGAADDPFDQIADCNTALTAGQTCEIRDGDYWKDPIQPVNSGTAGNPITYRNAPGARPNIHFTETVLNGPWTLVSGTPGTNAIYRMAGVTAGPNNYCREDTWVEAGQHTLPWNRETQWCATDGCNVINGPGQFYFDNGIVWRFSDSDNPTGRDLACFDDAAPRVGVVLDNRSHIVVKGMRVQMVYQWTTFTNATHITYQDNQFWNQGFNSIGNGSSWIKFIDNEIRAEGQFNADTGDIVIDDAHHILFKGNHSLWSGHNVLAMDNVTDVILRDNTLCNGGRQVNVNFVESNALNVVERFTVENNDFCYTSPVEVNTSNQVRRAGNDAMGLRFRGGVFPDSGVIFAGNRCWNTSGCLWLIGQFDGNTAAELGSVQDVHIYNNTCVGTQGGADGSCLTLSVPGGTPNADPVKGNKIKNQLYYQNETGRDHDTAGFASFNDQEVGNIWDDADGDPQFVRYTWSTDAWPSNLGSQLNPDLTPQNSAVLSFGGDLTTTRAAGVDTMTVPVVSAGYFMDGYDGLDPAHSIEVGNNAPVLVTEVNYATNTITVASPITFANGDSVNHASVKGTGSNVRVGAWQGTVNHSPDADFFVTGDQGYDDWLSTSVAGATGNAVYDASGAVFHFRNLAQDEPTAEGSCSGEPINRFPVTMRTHSGTTLQLPLVLGEISLGSPEQPGTEGLWGYYYPNCNAFGIRLGVGTENNITLRGARITRVWDGVRTTVDNGQQWTIEDTWITNARDDCIENDNGRPGVLRDSLLDGCFQVFSARPGSGSVADYSNQTVTIDGVLAFSRVHKHSEAGNTLPRDVTGTIFKISSASPKFIVNNSTFAIEGTMDGGATAAANNLGGVLGDSSVDPDYGSKRVSCSNVTVLWLPDDNPPQILNDLASCVTVQTGATAQATWNARKCNWIQTHQEPTTRWISAAEANAYNEADALCP